MKMKVLYLTASFPSLSAAVPQGWGPPYAGPPPPQCGGLQTISEFPNNTWIENLVVRSNGNVLVTMIGDPVVYEIDPFVYPATATLIYTFPDATATLGIAEYAPNIFAVNVGNFSLTAGAKQGSWSVWSLDLNNGIAAHKIANLPDAMLLNGMTVLPANPNIVLTADSLAGKIYSVDAQNGNTEVAISGSFLQPNTSAALTLGVNGIQFAPNDAGSLYFDNTFKAPNFASVPVDPSTGIQAGAIDAVFQYPSYPTNEGFSVDDFTFDSTGQIAWLATDSSDSLVKLDLSTGQATVVLGGINSSQLVGPTSCKFGRAWQDVQCGRLYITTNGGLGDPPPSGVTGGKLYAYDTGGSTYWEGEH